MVFKKPTIYSTKSTSNRQFIQQNQPEIGDMSAFCNFPLLHDIQKSNEIICKFGITVYVVTVHIQL